MDEDRIIDKIQVLLLGMEEKTSVRFDRLESRFDRVDTKLDSVSRELALNNELMAPFLRWSHHVKDEIIRLPLSYSRMYKNV